VTTIDLEELFNRKSRKDLDPLFNLYLHTTDKLEIGMKRTRMNEYLVKLQNIDMTLPLAVITNEGIQNIMVDKKGVNVKSTTLPIIDPDMMYLKKITVE
jgi:hypothetical protein